MDEKDYFIVEAMEKWGGSFVQALAKLARAADPLNLGKIKVTWSNYWSEYEERGEELRKAQ